MSPAAKSAEGSPRSTECSPCRGTGKLISSLGGAPHEVSCPWCDGTGSFQPGHDAQAAGAKAEPARADAQATRT